jgi:hypothetical protein
LAVDLYDVTGIVEAPAGVQLGAARAVQTIATAVPWRARKAVVATPIVQADPLQ